jgi:hypothetical protein
MSWSDGFLKKMDKTRPVIFIHQKKKNREKHTRE